MFNRMAAVLGISLCLLAQRAAAQDTCKDVLVPDRYTGTFSYQQELALASTIKSADEYQRAVSAGAGGSVAGLFDAHASYGDFVKKTNQLLREINYSLNENEASSIVASIVPESARQKWLDCNLSQNGGVKLYFTHITSTDATVQFIWRPLSGVPVAVLRNVEVIGSTTSKAKVAAVLGSSFSSPTERHFNVERENHDLTVIVNVHTKGDSVLLPYIPVPPLIPEPAIAAGCVRLPGLFNVPVAGSPAISLEGVDGTNIVRLEHQGSRFEKSETDRTACWADKTHSYRAYIWNVPVPAGRPARVGLTVAALPGTDLAWCFSPSAAVSDREAHAGWGCR